MYKYTINTVYDLIPLELHIVNTPINKNGFADILSINLEYSHKLNRAKNRINDINAVLWEEVKKITNPYEFIHAYNSKNKSNDHRSVAMISPLSRSFFKMIEMIYEFCPNIINQNQNQNQTHTSLETEHEHISKLISVHIAEGPGGFIEAVRYVRRIKRDKPISYVNNTSDRAFGMTLVKYKIDNTTKHIHVPGWKNSNTFLNNNPEVYIINGSDGTGNIYKTENLNFLYDEVSRISESQLGAYFITADGGFDYSVEYNYQEQTSSKLIFSQIIGALKCQAIGGTFICKFFDINLFFTVEMLYLLYTLYDKIHIYKPYTSRIANSEKYIICSNFKGIHNQFLESLYNILYIWNSNEEQTINHMFVNIPLPFIEKIKDINKEIIDTQVKSINTAIDIIKNKKMYLDKAWCDMNIDIQIQKAKEWCKKYNIPYKG